MSNNVTANTTFIDPNFINYMIDRGENFSEVLSELSKNFDLVTSVRALQEVVYRYQILGDTEKGYQRASDLKENCRQVFSVGTKELDELDQLMELYPTHPPRELIHLASMKTADVKRIICSPESSYSSIEDIESVSPVTMTSARF